METSLEKGSDLEKGENEGKRKEPESGFVTHLHKTKGREVPKAAAKSRARSRSSSVQAIVFDGRVHDEAWNDGASLHDAGLCGLPQAWRDRSFKGPGHIVPSNAASANWWSIVLHLLEVGQASKTQEFDLTIVMDMEYTTRGWVSEQEISTNLYSERVQVNSETTRRRWLSSVS